MSEPISMGTTAQDWSSAVATLVGSCSGLLLKVMVPSRATMTLWLSAASESIIGPMSCSLRWTTFMACSRVWSGTRRTMLRTVSRALSEAL